MPTTFRWNVTRREQLGRLIDDGPDPQQWQIDPEFRRCCARVIAMAGDSNLVFIGRSPERIYDYLQGAFADSSWTNRLTLFNVSLKSYREWLTPSAAEIRAIREHLKEVGLSPAAIASSDRAVALVDLIYVGETFGILFDLLFAWARDERVDDRAVRRRLRIVGITEQSRHGPKTQRWQQLEWARRFRPGALKGVAIPYWLWTSLGDSERKVSRSNPPSRWTDPEMLDPPRESCHKEALGIAHATYIAARSRAERDALRALLSEQVAVREPWCRALIAELRGRARRHRLRGTFTSKRLRTVRRRHVGRGWV
jgi:hypothetical protein